MKLLLHVSVLAMLCSIRVQAQYANFQIDSKVYAIDIIASSDNKGYNIRIYGDTNGTLDSVTSSVTLLPNAGYFIARQSVRVRVQPFLNNVILVPSQHERGQEQAHNNETAKRLQRQKLWLKIQQVSYPGSLRGEWRKFVDGGRQDAG